MKNRAEWCTTERLGAWDRIKAAFANDWEQTKRDMGSKSARDLDQDVDDTVKQALGTDDAIENHEQALRFGYAAQSQYSAQYPEWNDSLDDRLRADYEGDYDADRGFIRHAYHYRPRSAK